MNRSRQQSDVCILGAGPAGSCLAARLVALGYDVCLIEKNPFPRRRQGESLSRGVLSLLEVVGARKAIDSAGFPRARELLMHWGTSTPELRQDSGMGGILVDRGVFDTLLLNHVRDLGVRVFQPATIRALERQTTGWDLHIELDGSPIHLSTRFVADAGGRKGALGGRRRRTGRRTLALFAYWKGSRLPREPRIEAGTEAWFWGMPLPDRTYTTLVMIDADHFRQRRGVSIEQLFHELLATSSLLTGSENAQLDSPIRAIDVTASMALDVASIGAIKIGDAGLAIDPLSSSGVQRAIQTALSGAIAINTILRRPDSADAAISFYRGSLERASAQHHGWTASQYRAVLTRFDSHFWQSRAEGAFDAEPPPRTADQDERLMLSPEVDIVDAPCIDGDFVTIKAALEHPAFDGPIAYLGGHEITPLLRDVPVGATLHEIVHRWSSRVPPASSLTLAKWLIARGVIVPVSNRPHVVRDSIRLEPSTLLRNQ